MHRHLFRAAVLVFIASIGTIVPLDKPVVEAGSASTPIWIGSPFAAQYGGTGGRGGHPTDHAPYSGNWAMDLFKGDGTTDASEVTSTSAYVFAAAKDGRTITAKILQVINSSCGAGQNIRVGFYDGSTLVGWVSYTHVNSPWANGYTGSISPWGGYLGKIYYTPPSKSCWQVNFPSSGHLHIEAKNAVGSSCYRNLPAGSRVKKSEYIGYIGRDDSGACAAGA